MEDVLVHFYNAIAGQCLCGAQLHPDRKDFSVFPDRVTCPECLKKLTAGNSEAS